MLPPMSSPLRIGLVFEGFDSYPRRPGEPADAHVEYEPERTVELLESAIRALGHEPVRLGAPPTLAKPAGRAALADVDAALNIAEGQGSRNREAWAPVLLEMAGVPTLGSDALTLSLSLDKDWARRWAAAAGIPVPAGACLRGAAEAEHGPLPAAFPLFVKPRWEGTSKGIRASSKVRDRGELAREVERVVRDYRQPALVEAFLPGAEYTVTVVGHGDARRALAPLQRALERDTGIGLHALEGVHGGADGVAPMAGLAHALPGRLDGEGERALESLALRCFDAFECRDFARVDFRLDAAERPWFLEINPLPTFAPDGSFGILAELEGVPAAALVADVLAGGLARLGLAAPRAPAASEAAGRAGGGLG